MIVPRGRQAYVIRLPGRAVTRIRVNLLAECRERPPIYTYTYEYAYIYYSIISYLLLIIYYLLFIIYYLLFIIYYLLFIIYYLLGETLKFELRVGEIPLLCLFIKKKNL